jgi:hypothetical protein
MLIFCGATNHRQSAVCRTVNRTYPSVFLLRAEHHARNHFGCHKTSND